MNKIALQRDIPALLAQAEAHCAQRGARLTPVRRQVLELVLAYPDVVKAYDILNDLQRLRGSAAPPTVYRALEFFVTVGILHRAELLNGFVFCDHFADCHTCIILSCDHCGHTEELPASEAVGILRHFCRAQGFSLSPEPLVFSGQCRRCGAQTP